MGRGVLLPEGSSQSERVIVECHRITRPRTAIGSVSGSMRQRKNRDEMDPERRRRLEGLPGWSWDPLSDQWEEGFSRLKEFSEREGHCRVPGSYKTEDGYRLGGWVSASERQRRTRWIPTVGGASRQLPGWSWDPLSDQWEEGFSHLKEFSEREGHCRVPELQDRGRLSTWSVGH